MIGMDFESFLTLLILGIIAAIVMHGSVCYPTSQGADSFFAKWIARWIGAWLVSSVLGYWSYHMQNVHVIPALAAFAGVFSLMYFRKAVTVAATARKQWWRLQFSQRRKERRAKYL